MKRREIAGILIASAAGAAMVTKKAEAQTCTAPCFARTAAEIAAGVTPSNLSYEPSPADPRRYGAIGNGNTSNASADTAGLQTACTVAGVSGGVVKIHNGVSLVCNANINVSVGQGVAVDIEGSGWTQFGISFTGFAVTTGLTYAGSMHSYAGSIRNIGVQCMSGAVQCVTYTNCTKPFIWQCWLYGATSRGAYFSTCIMPVIENTLISGCGSATFGMLEFDNCTTVGVRHSYLGTGNTSCVGGLLLDQCSQVLIEGGAIESCGTPILISSKTGASAGCAGVTIRAIDLENPGNGNRYIDVGAGLSGGDIVDAVVLDGWTGYPTTATTTQPSGVRFQNTSGAECRIATIAVAGAYPNYPGAIFELAGTTNSGVHIFAQHNLYGSPFPWVTLNGAQVKAASPYYDWVSGDAPRGLAAGVNSISGATPSILIGAQGGYFSVLEIANSSPITVVALSGGETGMQITLIAVDSNSTLTYGIGAGQFATLTGSNLPLMANKAYSFVSNGTCWIQH